MKTLNMGFLALLRNKVTCLELERRYREAADCRSLLKQAELAVLHPDKILPAALAALDLQVRRSLGIRPE